MKNCLTLIDSDPQQSSEIVKSPQSAFDLLPINEQTRADYKKHIGVFVGFIRDNGNSVNRQTLLEFKRWLEARSDLAVSTKNKYFIVAKRYCGVLFNAGLIPVDITKDLGGADYKGFKQSSGHKKAGLSAEDIAKIQAHFEASEQSPEALKTQCMFTLLALQGLRACELVRLDIADIDLNARIAFVKGKGADDKAKIPLQPQTCQIIADYLKAFNLKSGCLFTSQSNNSFGQRLTTRTIQRVMLGLFAKCGVDKAKTTHGLRHYFATTLAEHYNGDIVRVSRYTRHKSVSSVMCYIDEVNAQADLPNFYQAFSGQKQPAPSLAV